MSSILGDPELSGAVKSRPKYPGIVSLDITPALRGLYMHTNRLHTLSAPPELCVMKALELISDRNNYHFNVDLFKMELLNDAIDLIAVNDVSSLINGIRSIGDFLIKTMDDLTGEVATIFPYQFFKLLNKQLFMTIIETDDPSQYIPSSITLPKPAYMYRELSEKVGTDHITEACEPMVLR